MLLFLRHLWSGQLLCVKKIYSGFAPAGSLCLHPARLPYNLVGVPGYPRPQALVDHIRHISTHKPLHQCTLRSYRQDSRSHSSGFCILDVYSHRPVHRSEYLTGHLHRHHPDPRYYEAAVSCPYNRPPAWLPRYAGNVSAHKIQYCKIQKVLLLSHNTLLNLCVSCPNAYSHPFLFWEYQFLAQSATL